MHIKLIRDYMAFIKAAAKSEFPEGKGKKVVIGGKNIGVFNIDGKFYAIDHKCTHMGGPLSQSEVKDFCVTCPWHGSEFDIRTGALKKGPALRPVKSYPVKVEGEDVLVEI